MPPKLNLKLLFNKHKQETTSLNQLPLHSSEIQYSRGSNDALIITILIGAVLSMTAVIAFVYFFNIGPEEGQVAAVGTPDILQPDEGDARDVSAFSGLTIEARAAIVYDLKENTILYAHDEEEQLPLASLAKLMTALVAAEILESDQEITISAEDLRAEGDSGFVVNELWKFNDLLDYTLITSSNDGAQAIAATAGAFLSGAQLSANTETLRRLTFVQKMNARARELKLDETYFVNASGLDVGQTSSGSYGSALDVALLLDHILATQPEILDATSKNRVELASADGTVHTAHNTNQRIGKIPGMIASKTGFTDLAGGNLAIVFDTSINHPVAIVVLGSTYEDRFTDIELLAGATQRYFMGKEQSLE